MKFDNNEREIECETVGDVIDALSKLDRDMGIWQDFNFGVRICIVNDVNGDQFIEFEDIEQ